MRCGYFIWEPYRIAAFHDKPKTECLDVVRDVDDNAISDAVAGNGLKAGQVELTT